MRSFTAAVVQNRATDDRDGIPDRVLDLARRAVDAGADLVVQSEAHAAIGSATDRRAWAFPSGAPGTGAGAQRFLLAHALHADAVVVFTRIRAELPALEHRVFCAETPTKAPSFGGGNP